MRLSTISTLQRVALGGGLLSNLAAATADLQEQAEDQHAAGTQGQLVHRDARQRERHGRVDRRAAATTGERRAGRRTRRARAGGRAVDAATALAAGGAVARSVARAVAGAV